MPYVDTNATHKAVDFLGYFEEGNRAQKPDQYISGDLLPACRADGRLYFTFFDSKRGDCQNQRQKHHQQYRGKIIPFSRNGTSPKETAG